MKKVFNLVITGGPCGGKSTAIAKIFDELTKKGYCVLVVPETATEMIINGVTSKLIGDINFQEVLFKKQLQKEELYRDITKFVQNDKVIVIYDRGLMDNKCYMSDKQFYNMLKKFNTNEVEIKSRYDAVFHMVTAADGKEKFYTTANNEARSENIEQARKLDKKCICAWNGHSQFKIIDNSTDFENKIKRLLNEIYHIIGDPIPIQIQRKFLIKTSSINDIPDNIPVTTCDIVQYYLKSENDFERKIRSIGINGNFSYTFTQKKDFRYGERIKLEEKISSKQFLKLLLEQRDISMDSINKKRMCLVYNSQYIQIDIFDFSQDIAIMELELTNMTQNIDIPACIEVIKEITYDSRYSNYNIAKQRKFF